MDTDDVPLEFVAAAQEHIAEAVNDSITAIKEQSQPNEELFIYKK